ncbi:MAG: toxin-antitoxin system YwqK family antitoxin [Cyclobacteriaceae bacterium]|nr:toxin-antitoxin system YwqK family antitoxin [Cyclobacteriaceae bacterium]
MKKIIIPISFIFLIACNSPQDQTTVSDDDLLIGAVETPFEDEPGMSFVTTNDSQGNISTSGIYVDGIREGSWVEYHPNGLAKTIVGYENGMREGQGIELDNRGQMLERFTYHKDKLDGPYTKYNRTRVKEENNYKNGKLEGESKVYYDNGKIMEESTYKDGKRDGIARWYDQEGNMTIEYMYKDGEWIKDEE